MLKCVFGRLPRILVALVVALPLGFQGMATGAEGDEAITSAPKAHERQRGAEMYRARCAECHGETADGKRIAGASLLAPEQHEKLRRGAAYDFGHSGQPPHPHAAVQAPRGDELAAIGDYIQNMLAAPLPDGNLARGEQIYRLTCSVCHGDKGNGASWAKTAMNPSPLDFASPKARTLSRLHMADTVSHGNPKTAMVGYSTQLSRRDIIDVVDYIRSAFVFPAGRDEHAAHGHSSADMAAAMSRGLSGDRDRGGELFRANCTACHGEQGDGNGPRAYFMTRKPADFRSASAREQLNRPHLFTGIADGVLGSEMPAWSKVLTDQQISDLAEYVFTSFVRPAASHGEAGIHDGSAAHSAHPAPTATPGHGEHDRGAPAATPGQGEHGHTAPAEKASDSKKK